LPHDFAFATEPTRYGCVLSAAV